MQGSELPLPSELSTVPARRQWVATIVKFMCQKVEFSSQGGTHQSDEPKFIVTIALCMGGCPIATLGGLLPGMLVGPPHAQVTRQLFTNCKPEGLSRLAIRPLHIP